jgi:general secretion pathway protein B
MSYILDALRRADAERQRGQVPGLHAPSSSPGAPAAGAPPRTALWAALAALGLVGAGLAGWWLWREPVAPAVALPAGAPMAPATVVQPQATVTAPAAAPPPAPVATTLPVVVSAPSPAPALVPALPTPAPPPVAALPAPPPVAALPAPPPTAATPAPPRPGAAPEPRAVPLAELSPEQRRELPPMAVGGSIWSDSAANRFVIINGQLVREGESAAPGVALERIGPKSAVLRWRELRIELPL